MNNRESVLFAKIMAFAAIVFSSGGLLAGNSFVPLEYIESSGTQYIDTGVPANSVYAAELGMSVVSVKCDPQAYLGSANDDYFSFMDKYLLDWNPPEGFSITVR